MMNQRLLHYVGMMIVSLSLLGCGVKGDLYYPTNSTSNTSTKSTPTNSAAQNEAQKTADPKTNAPTTAPTSKNSKA